VTINFFYENINYFEKYLGIFSIANISMFSNEFVPKNPLNFCCDKCDYITSNKKDYSKHINTNKHKINENQCFSIQKSPKIPTYECSCGKSYKDNSGLWRHKKKCKNNGSNIDENEKFELNDPNDSVELIKYLMQENSEFKQMLIEQNKQMIEIAKTAGTYNNITNTNSHNKSFNLNFFLNETCKDAMNIMDFVDSLKIQLSDLENVGELGYVEGISNIIIKNLNLLDETKRPVHCTDTKREVLYVKDENKWEKENEEKSKMRKVIKHVTHKNSKLLKEFKQKYPGCEKSESKYSGKYDKLIIESMGGKGDNDIEKEDKIIKNISKKITIDKAVL